MFQSLCGQRAMENVFLTTTQWSNVDPAEGQAREDELQGGGLWGELISKGATLQRFHGTRESGFELIGKLMLNTQKPLDIQDQIVEQNMTLLETNAGRCINEELIVQEQKFKKQLDSLEKRLQDVMRPMGGEMENLMEEQAKTRQKLQEAGAGMKLLAELHAAEAKKREAKGKKRHGGVEGHGKDGAPGPSDPRRFHGTRESGLELIDKLVPKTRKPLHIQDQIVKQNMALLGTNAGKCINEELIALEKKYKEKIETLEKGFREAIKAKDDEIKAMGDEMRALKEEQAKAEDKLEKSEAGMGVLAELHAAGVKKREAREREEKARTCDQAVIAVAIKDIAITADITGVLTSYKTRGRLILDINSHEEFESDTFEVTINYQLNLLPGIRVYTNTSRGGFNGLIGDIVLHGVHYQWKSGASVSIGNEEFVIFSKD